MAIKVDKDFLLKHHFWMILGVAALLTLVGWLIVVFSAPSQVSAERTKVNSKWESAAKYKDFKHPKEVERAKERADRLGGERTNVHTLLYQEQAKNAALMTFPAKMEEQFNPRSSRFAVTLTFHPPGTKAASLPVDNKFTENGTFTGTFDSSTFDIVLVKPRDGKTTEHYPISRDFKITEAGKTEAIPMGDLAKKIYHNRAVTVTYITGHTFGDEFSKAELRKYAETYRSQLDDVLADIGPINALGKPLVQFRYGETAKAGTGRFPGSFPGSPGGGFPGGGGGVVGSGKDDLTGDYSEDDFYNETWVYKKGKLPPPDNRFMPYVPKWSERFEDNEGVSEEVWAAQENLWITRDMFKRLKAANDALAYCKPAGKTKDGFSRFRNYYWEVDLRLGDKGATVRLKNQRPKSQILYDLHFVVRVKDKDNKVETVLVPPKDASFDHPALAPAGSRDGKDVTDKDLVVELPGLEGREIVGVEQVLTSETAAVKRIDALIIGASVNGDKALPHRYAYRTLVPYKKKAAPKDDDSTKKDSGAEPGKGPPKGPKEMPGGPGVPGGDPNAQLTDNPHRLVLDRYLEVTSEARKAPVCLVIIVDPDHVNLVLAKLAESPLRLLIAQPPQLQRAQVTLRGPEEDKKKGFEPGGKSGIPGGPGGPGSPGYPGGPGQGDGEPAASSDEESIELTVYGIVTLYERPRTNAPAGPATDEKKQP